MTDALKNLIRPTYNLVRNYLKKKKFEQDVSARKKDGLPIKIVIGSANIYDDGWIPSEEYILNLLDEQSWKYYFSENEIESLLAEHVWEHLTIEQGVIGAAMCFKYLKTGGYIRLAVPDGYHSNQEYIDYVKPGGYGLGADDHKVLYNYKSFSSIFTKVGFEVKLLEYFDEKGNFHFDEWNVNQGKINRSIRFDSRNKDGEPNYTSLIIDAIKA